MTNHLLQFEGYDFNPLAIQYLSPIMQTADIGKCYKFYVTIHNEKIIFDYDTEDMADTNRAIFLNEWRRCYAQLHY